MRELAFLVFILFKLTNFDTIVVFPLFQNVLLRTVIKPYIVLNDRTPLKDNNKQKTYRFMS